MENAFLLVAAGLLFVGGAIIFTRRSRASDNHDKHDELVDLTRRNQAPETPQPAPGGPE